MSLYQNLAVVLLLSLSLNAHASLGDGEASIAVEAKSMSAEHSATREEAYEVHILKMQTTVIKEYLSKDGVIFALTWSGTKKPDLARLLGSSYDEYAAEKNKLAKVKGRHPNTVKTGNIYVHGGGHMRALYGIAYIPSAVPPGVNVDMLK